MHMQPELTLNPFALYCSGPTLFRVLRELLNILNIITGFICEILFQNSFSRTKEGKLNK